MGRTQAAEPTSHSQPHMASAVSYYVYGILRSSRYRLTAPDISDGSGSDVPVPPSPAHSRHRQLRLKTKRIVSSYLHVQSHFLESVGLGNSRVHLWHNGHFCSIILEIKRYGGEVTAFFWVQYSVSIKRIPAHLSVNSTVHRQRGPQERRTRTRARTSNAETSIVSIDINYDIT